jgi:hypothetical protein
MLVARVRQSQPGRGGPGPSECVIAQSAGLYSQPGRTKIDQAVIGAMMIMLMPHCRSFL